MASMALIQITERTLGLTLDATGTRANAVVRFEHGPE